MRANHSRTTLNFNWVAVATNLLLAATQLVLFLPAITNNRSFNLLVLPSGPLFRADTLAVVLGVAWTLSAAMAALSSRREPALLGLPVSIGALVVAYAREPVVLYAGWEVAGLGLWLALRSRSRLPLGWLAIALNAAGWPVLVLILLGLVPPLAPPAGGLAQPWSLPVALALGIVVLARAGCWPFDRWPRLAFIRAGYFSLLPLYMLLGPYLLAKCLVAAPWSPGSTWALTLLGVTALLATIALSLRRVAFTLPAALAAATLVAFALSPGSPLAALGGVGLLLAGLLFHSRLRTPHSAFLLAGGLAGAWLVSQAGLETHYGLAAVLLLPALALVALLAYHLPGNTESASWDVIAGVLSLALLAGAIYPQGMVEWVLRPAVRAMAGGVGTPSLLASDWGLGLAVTSASEGLLAALPATGIAIAVGLALVVLYWLKRLFARFAGESHG